MNLLGMLRTSEFWVAVATGLGQLGASLGLWPQATFNEVLMPAIVYVIGRIMSKIAKTTVPTTK